MVSVLYHGPLLLLACFPDIPGSGGLAPFSPVEFVDCISKGFGDSFRNPVRFLSL